MGAFLQDVRYALRGIRRAPFLTIAVLMALSAGIGLNTAVFTLLESTWFRAPVTRDPGSFVQAIATYSGPFETEKQFRGFSVRDFGAVRAHAQSLRAVAAYSRHRAQLEDGSTNANLWLVTCNFFGLYGWGPPEKGRLLLPQECANPGSAPVAVMSDAFWKSRYAADPRIIGRVIHLDGHPYTVVGVLDAPAPVWMRADIWVPYTMQAEIWRGYNGFKDHPDYPWLSIVGRLKHGFAPLDARAELRLIESRQDRLIPGRKTTVEVTNGSLAQDPGNRSLESIILPLILGPMFLILLVACTNVTVLLLSRAAARRGEIAMRLTLGAGRGRLLRMLVTEGLVVAAAAGAISLYLAYRLPGVFWVFVLRGGGFRTLGPDWRVFSYLAALTLIAGCIAGFAPARVSLDVDLMGSLKGQEATAVTRSRARSTLIVAQLAMSFVLVAAGVLFVRLERSVIAKDPGFEERQVLVVSLSAPEPPYTRESAASFYRMARARVSEIPGVRSASFTDAIPFAEPPTEEIRVPGEAKGKGQRVEVERVSPGFFGTLGIRIVRGRSFQDVDATARGTTAIAVVSRAFAAAYWKGRNPVGKVVVLPDNTQRLVVGVARDVASNEFDVPDGPRLYLPQNPRAFTGSLLVRFEGKAGTLAPVILRTIQGLDSRQTIVPVTLRSLVEQEAEKLRPLTEVMVFMALLALLLAAAGVYGTVAFSMRQRTREFGVRMALGATKGIILRSVIVSGIRQIGLGLSVGVLLALPAAIAFGHLVPSASVFDWRTYAAAALTLTLAALSAYYVPARRAMMVDPIEALRYE